MLVGENMDLKQTICALTEGAGVSGAEETLVKAEELLKEFADDVHRDILMGSFTEVQKYMTLANFQYSDQFLILNGDLFDSLTEEERRVMLEAAREANNLTRERIEALDARQIEECREKGLQVYTPNAEEMEQFRTLGQPAYLEWLKGRVDKAWVDMALRDAEAANAGK